MKTFKTSREIPATPEKIFAAISNPSRLAKWWGPNGFTNTNHSCAFENGGQWVLTMHGPDGSNYPNEYIFVEIVAPQKVIVQHLGEPKFRLTISLAASPNGTTVSWQQDFESVEVANRMEHIVVPANDQNLVRLEMEVWQK